MFCFRNFILIFPLSILLKGCGYTIPDYIDAQRFKDTPPFLKIAKQQHYKALTIKSISEVAINQNYITYLCHEDQIAQLCILNQQHELIKKLPIPLAVKHETYLLLDETNHLFVLTKDLTNNIHILNPTKSIRAFEVELETQLIKQIDVIDTQQIKTALIHKLTDQNKLRKKKHNEIDFDGVLYEDLAYLDSSTNKIEQNQNESSEVVVLTLIYDLFKYFIESFWSLFQDLSNSLITTSGNSISDQQIAFDELPQSALPILKKEVELNTANNQCIQAVSNQHIDYLIKSENTSRILINNPFIDQIIEEQKIPPCYDSTLSDVTSKMITREIVTKNHYSGNHYIGGYTPEGFNLFEINNQQFQAPLNTLNIYQKNQYHVVEFNNTHFYLATL